MARHDSKKNTAGKQKSAPAKLQKEANVADDIADEDVMICMLTISFYKLFMSVSRRFSKQKNIKQKLFRKSKMYDYDLKIRDQNLKSKTIFFKFKQS